MSSTTPGSQAPDGAEPDDAERQQPDHGGVERTAIRTSLAERFALAKEERQPVTAEQAPSSPLAETAVRPPAADTSPGPAATSATQSPRFGATSPDTGHGGEPGGPRPTAAPGHGAQPRAGAAAPAAERPAAERPTGPRRVRLSLARIDPWSVMKLAFLLSIAVGIGIMVAAAAMWFLLDSMHVFADIRDLLDTLGSENFLELMQYTEFDRVISMAAIVAVVDVLLLTALATLGAFLYNIVASLVGGLHLTLTDD